jgi:hypothetical protein
MRLRTTYQNSKDGSGFMIVEVILAFSILTLFTISIFALNSSMQRLQIWSISELEKLKILVKDFDNETYASSTVYGNNSVVYSNELFRLSKSDYKKSWGRDTCYPRLQFDENKVNSYLNGINIGIGNNSTDIEVRNDFVYLSADSSVASMPDFYIIDNTNPSSPSIVSSLNTGPGINAIDVAGPYVFVAQASTANQLQIIDIHDRNNPKVISQLKVKLPTATTTPPFAQSIYYKSGYIYLGTSKWNGEEFNIIDVSNIKSPVIVGTFDTGTLINDVSVLDDKAYLATSDQMQMRTIDLSDKSKPKLLDSFSSSGWQTQEGKVIDVFEGSISLGRTVGGFNVVSNHEIFLFSSTTDSRDIPGGVYGILQRTNDLFILTHANAREFQVFDLSMKNKKYDFPLSSSPVKMACDNSKLYFATGKSNGFVMLNLKKDE